jgi:hypothetical protein
MFIRAPLLAWMHAPTTESDGRSPSAKTFTPEPGQYLAYIRLYIRLHRRPKPPSSNIFASQRLQFTKWC